MGRRARQRPERLAELSRLMLAPSDIRLAALEGIGTPPFAVALRAEILSLGSRFDFAVIDAPSSLGPLTEACLFASTHVIAPVAPRTQGVAGLDCLVRAMGDMPCAHGDSGAAWIVCNHFEPRERSSGEVYERLVSERSRQVFDTIIHRDSLVEGGAGWPVQLYAPASNASALYNDLTDEFLSRLGAA